MVKYTKEMEEKVMVLFGENTIVTTDMLSIFGMTPSIILNNLLNKGLVLRYPDPLHSKRYVYFLPSMKDKVNKEIKSRREQLTLRKLDKLKCKIVEVKRARDYHLKLVGKYDLELVELKGRLNSMKQQYYFEEHPR